MSEAAIVIVRHGATEWSENGRHTSFTDLPLLPKGRERARELRRALAGKAFARVLCSPLARARETCELAGFGDQMEICPDLTEWNYGEYEGLTTDEILARHPRWNLWRDGCPGGESPADVVARVDRVIDLAVGGSAGSADDAPAHASGAQAPTDVIAFAHGHVLRVLGARWMDLGAGRGERLLLGTATISKLGHEHTYRVIEQWNAATL